MPFLYLILSNMKKIPLLAFLHTFISCHQQAGIEKQVMKKKEIKNKKILKSQKITIEVKTKSAAP